MKKTKTHFLRVYLILYLIYLISEYFSDFDRKSLSTSKPRSNSECGKLLGVDHSMEIHLADKMPWRGSMSWGQSGLQGATMNFPALAFEYRSHWRIQLAKRQSGKMTTRGMIQPNLARVCCQGSGHGPKNAHGSQIGSQHPEVHCGNPGSKRNQPTKTARSFQQTKNGSSSTGCWAWKTVSPSSGYSTCDGQVLRRTSIHLRMDVKLTFEHV